ncbi:transforming growth factor beta activator LRRC33 [Pantherophis guttatus]|uniref:Transforming growth factor beta activator LRRC33 n=1 Tax=Pantherophis guttatus TaxID=94885 RepID=A0A6P9DSK6_PANGU|nr:transforming growth factor beta activator LRRC33 [Pantherophis guttatus]XP_034295457.1 transforming growth factor beta activator LRRC33 [Pantherophis guttatus]
MALIAVIISVCIAFLDTGWATKPTTYHSICKLKKRSADCNGRRLSSVPKDLPAGIEELFLDANVLQTLSNASFIQYHVLQNLSLHANGLELIEPGAFLGIRNLSLLTVSDNFLSLNYSVTASALWTLTYLRKLDLSGNQLTELMMGKLVQHLSSLESLSLARNAILRLDDSHFRNLPNLQRLDLQQNYIFEIEAGAFENMPALQQLNLAYNNIPCIVQFDLIQLQMLNVSNNHIEWFLSAENNASFELETLDLSYNQLLFFPLLPKLNKLQTLLLTHNHMNFYGKFFNNSNSSVQLLFLDGNIINITTQELWEENNHGNFSSLTFLDMSWNEFSYFPDYFFKGLISLLYLNLSHNCLKILNIEDREMLNTLIDLDLSHNLLSKLQMNLGSEGSLTNLRKFNLSTNNLHGLPHQFFIHVRKITTIDISKNPIHICYPYSATSPDCVTFTYANSLRNLLLSGCNLSMLSCHFFKGTSLTYLDLSNNPRLLISGLGTLKDITSSIQVLYLRNTGLSAAGTKMDFSAFQKLVNLDLSGNSLAYFPESLIYLKLYTLDLRMNFYHSLPQYFMEKQLGKSLRVIYLSENPYDCCKMGWWDTLQSHGTLRIGDMTDITCNYSSRFISATNIPESVHHDCRWLTTNMALLYLVLILPTCLTLLFTFIIVFLIYKEKILQMLKSRHKKPSPY